MAACELCNGRGEVARFKGCPYEGITLYLTGEHCPVCGVPEFEAEHELIPDGNSDCSYCNGTGEIGERLPNAR